MRPLSQARRIARTATSVALLTGSVGGIALAQERGGQPESGTQDFVYKTRFLESIKAEKWSQAVELFRSLESEYPQAVAQSPDLRFKFARALFNEKDHEAAARNLETILETQDEHVDALYLLARIRIKGEQQHQERAKEHLVQAARSGQFVLREINSKEGREDFDELRSDPAFILRVMKASNEFQAPSTPPRNPFESPLREGKGSDSGSSEEDQIFRERLDELEARIEQLFAQIVQLAEERQVEELVSKFTELRSLMNEFGEIGTSQVKEKLEEYNQKLQDLGEVRLSIKLQVYINDGNQHLRAMADAIREEEYSAALEHFTRIEEIAEEMRNEEREVFHRNADALFLRGQKLAERARRLKRISEFKLSIEGIVVAPPDGNDVDKAIVNDHIYKVDDTVLDRETEEEIDGLRVVKIARSTVTFRYEETEFVRELNASAP